CASHHRDNRWHASVRLIVSRLAAREVSPYREGKAEFSRLPIGGRLQRWSELGLRLQSALRTRVECIERRRATDVQSISLLAAEAQIGHRLRYVNFAEQFAASGVAAHAVLVRIAPADGAPDAAVAVGAQSIGDARLRHLRKDLAVRQFAILDIHIEHADM